MLGRCEKSFPFLPVAQTVEARFNASSTLRYRRCAWPLQQVLAAGLAKEHELWFRSA